jgi:hypothetical protein
VGAVRVGRMNTYVTRTGKITCAELTDGHCGGVAGEEESKGEQAREPLERRHVVLERVKECEKENVSVYRI